MTFFELVIICWVLTIIGVAIWEIIEQVFGKKILDFFRKVCYNIYRK